MQKRRNFWEFPRELFDVGLKVKRCPGQPKPRSAHGGNWPNVTCRGSPIPYLSLRMIKIRFSATQGICKRWRRCLSEWKRVAVPQIRGRSISVLPDRLRDMVFIEDAAYCIAKAFSKAQTSCAALKAVAAYAREHWSIFVVDGPKMLDRSEKARRQKVIESVADKLDELAAAASEGRAKYQEFENLLDELHVVGFYPEMSLISDVARSMV